MHYNVSIITQFLKLFFLIDIVINKCNFSNKNRHYEFTYLKVLINIRLEKGKGEMNNFNLYY